MFMREELRRALEMTGQPRTAKSLDLRRGEALSRAIKNAGFLAKQVAAYTLFDEGLLSKYLSGKGWPKKIMPKFRKLCRALRIRPEPLHESSLLVEDPDAPVGLLVSPEEKLRMLMKSDVSESVLDFIDTFFEKHCLSTSQASRPPSE